MIPGMDASCRGFRSTKRRWGSIEAIIQSMTPYERENPNVLNSAAKRIAAGSGTTVVKGKKGGMGGLAGLGSLFGGGGGKPFGL